MLKNKKSNSCITTNYKNQSQYKKQDLKLNQFIQRTVPMVGMVVTISPSFSLYRIVVFPAASSPTIRILISFLPNRPLNKLANTFPIVTNLEEKTKRRKLLKRLTCFCFSVTETNKNTQNMKTTREHMRRVCGKYKKFACFSLMQHHTGTRV